jgi:uncharacterized glyoxalase superfamily protein PhnB
VSGDPVLNQLNLVVRDVDAAVTFYRRLGLPIDAEPGAEHVAVRMPGIALEIDTANFVAQWDSGFGGATGGSTVIGFELPSREAVDTTYGDLVAAGYAGHQPPYDAFWGARYASVDDPDGNPVGLMSPIEERHRFWPPRRPPSR